MDFVRRVRRAFGWHLRNFLVARCFTPFLAFERTFCVQRVPGEFRVFLEGGGNTRSKNKARLICYFLFATQIRICVIFFFFLKNIYGLVCQDTIKEQMNLFNEETAFSFQGRNNLRTDVRRDVFNLKLQFQRIIYIYYFSIRFHFRVNLKDRVLDAFCTRDGFLRVEYRTVFRLVDRIDFNIDCAEGTHHDGQMVIAVRRAISVSYEFAMVLYNPKWTLNEIRTHVSCGQFCNLITGRPSRRRHFSFGRSPSGPGGGVRHLFSMKFLQRGFHNGSCVFRRTIRIGNDSPFTFLIACTSPFTSDEFQRGRERSPGLGEVDPDHQAHTINPVHVRHLPAHAISGECISVVVVVVSQRVP